MLREKNLNFRYRPAKKSSGALNYLNYESLIMNYSLRVHRLAQVSSSSVYSVYS